MSNLMLKADLRTTDTREKVIEEARRLYLAGGYSHLNLDVIARTLKITRPALYFHFPGGKEQLLQEVIYLFGIELEQQLQAATRGCPDVYSRLRNILLSVATRPLIDTRELCLAELEDRNLETRKQLQEVFRNVHRVITMIVEEGIASGELRPINPNIAVFSFLALCQQVVQFITSRHQLPQDFTDKFPEKIEELVDNLLDLWFKGIKGPDIA
jgi:AcrR family transcriptional regulator